MMDILNESYSCPISIAAEDHWAENRQKSGQRFFITFLENDPMNQYYIQKYIVFQTADPSF